MRRYSDDDVERRSMCSRSCDVRTVISDHTVIPLNLTGFHSGLIVVPNDQHNQIILRLEMRDVLNATNARIDEALATNRKWEMLAAMMAVVIFVLAITIIVVGIWRGYLYASAVAAGLSPLLYFALKEIGKIRRDNVLLQCLPALLEGLPPEKRAEVLIKLMQELRQGRAHRARD